MNPVHGNLDNICSRTLDRRVHSKTFTKGTLHRIRRFQFRHRSASSKHGSHISLLFCILYQLIKKYLDSRISFKIPVNIFLCFLRRNAQILRQAKGTDAINNSKIYCFCISSLKWCYFIKRHMKHLRSCNPVNVLCLSISFDQLLIT